MDQQNLYDTALPEAMTAFQAAVDKYQGEHFYGFCFCVAAPLNSVMPHANTLEGLQRILPDDSPDERPYYQWSSAEWDLEFDQRRANGFMRNTTAMLMAVLRDEDDGEEEQSAQQQRESLLTLAKVLLEVRKSGIFGKGTERNRPAFWLDSYEPHPMLELPNYYVGPYLDRVDHAEILRNFDIPTTFDPPSQAQQVSQYFCPSGRAWWEFSCTEDEFIQWFQPAMGHPILQQLFYGDEPTDITKPITVSRFHDPSHPQQGIRDHQVTDGIHWEPKAPGVYKKHRLVFDRSLGRAFYYKTLHGPAFDSFEAGS